MICSENWPCLSLEAQGKSTEICDWLRRAVAADPHHANARFELGRAFMSRDLKEAEAAFTRSVVLQPGDTDGWRSLARLRIRLGDWSGCQAALDHLPQDAEVRSLGYRVRAELGTATSADRDALLMDKSMRPDALKALTRVSKGSLPLRFPDTQ